MQCYLERYVKRDIELDIAVPQMNAVDIAGWSTGFRLQNLGESERLCRHESKLDEEAINTKSAVTQRQCQCPCYGHANGCQTDYAFLLCSPHKQRATSFSNTGTIFMNHRKENFLFSFYWKYSQASTSQPPTARYGGYYLSCHWPVNIHDALWFTLFYVSLMPICLKSVVHIFLIIFWTTDRDILT